MRRLPPAGTKLSTIDFVRWAKSIVSKGNSNTTLSAQIMSKYQTGPALAVSSGRAALCLILSTLRSRCSNKTEVILPAYTCYSLPACVISSGLRVRLVDVDPISLRISAASLRKQNMDNVLAVIPTSLYGIPEDLPALEEIIEPSGACMIDDAAQAMGASIAGRSVGTFGDAGLFSFDKGKTLTSVQGGIALVNSKALEKDIESVWQEMPRPSFAHSSSLAIQSIAYAVLLNPYLYSIPSSLPWLGLGKTVFDTDFPVTLYPRLQEALAASLLPKIDAIIATRRANAKLFKESLEGIGGLSMIEPPADSTPTYVRFPVIFDDPRRRDEVLRHLMDQGMGASGSYPSSIADVPEVVPHLVGDSEAENARNASSRIMTLPTHGYVGESDIDRIVDTLRAY